MRRFYAIEDEKQASLQNAPPPAPAVADFGDDEVISEEDQSDSDDDDYGDDFEEEAEEEDSSRKIIRMCYCCGSTRESEKSIREHVLVCRKRWLRRERYRPTSWRRPLPRFGWCRLPGPSAASEALKAYSEAAERLSLIHI